MTGSALTPRGSTRRWRRIRALVLNRDGHRCRFIVEEATGRTCGAFASHVHHVEGRVTDDPAHLIAACATHNLSKGDELGIVARDTTTPRHKAATRWSW